MLFYTCPYTAIIRSTSDLTRNQSICQAEIEHLKSSIVLQGQINICIFKGKQTAHNRPFPPSWAITREILSNSRGNPQSLRSGCPCWGLGEKQAWSQPPSHASPELEGRQPEVGQAQQSYSSWQVPGSCWQHSNSGASYCGFYPAKTAQINHCPNNSILLWKTKDPETEMRKCPWRWQLR